MSLADESKMTEFENKIAEMKDVCTKYETEEKERCKLVTMMEKELRSLKTKLKISEKENKMLDTYRTQNKSLESSLINCKKELKEFKQKCDIFQSEQDMLESYKANNRLLESNIKSLNEEISRLNRKSERLELHNNKVNDRVTTFTSLTRIMYNSMKPVLETDEAFLEFRNNLPDLTKSKSEDTAHTHNSLPISRSESTNYETLMDDFILDADVIPQTDI